MAGEIKFGTKKWGDMNRRRCELIRKKNREGLSPDEMEEFQSLQKLVGDELDHLHPAPHLFGEELRAILDRKEKE